MEGGGDQLTDRPFNKLTTMVHQDDANDLQLDQSKQENERVCSFREDSQGCANPREDRIAVEHGHACKGHTLPRHLATFILATLVQTQTRTSAHTHGNVTRTCDALDLE